MRNVANGTDGCATYLAHPFGNGVGDVEYLRGMFIEEQMIVAEVRPAHVPVEVFGLEIKGKCIGQQGIQHTGEILDLFGGETVWNVDFGYV